MTELEKEMSVLRSGLKSIEAELQYQQAQSSQYPVDRFVPVVSQFITVASFSFSDVEDSLQDAKDLFVKALRHFGEDSSNLQPDEFFGTFSSFLAAYSDARQDNEDMARRREEEEKRALVEAQMKKERELKMRKAAGNEEEEGGEFDDLVSALRSGEVFDQGLSKMNHRKPRKQKEVVSSRERPVSKLNLDKDCL